MPGVVPVRVRARVVAATGVVWVAAVGLSLTLSLAGGARLVAVGGALAIGWSHLTGRCGVSHLGTLTPRGKIAGQRRWWLVQSVVYALAGVLASALVGAGLAGAGSLLVPDGLRWVAVAAVLLLAAVAAAGDLGLVGWRLPQPVRQTRQVWGYTFRRPVAAALWGFGLGLTFATVFTFSGVWLVLALPVALGDVGFGVVLLVVHWLGRAVPILLGPLLLDSAASTDELLDEIESSRNLFRATNVAGIVLVAVALVGLLVSGV